MNANRPLAKLEVPAKNVVGVISNTLNLVDSRLVNHGRRVAELVCRALRVQGGYSPEQLRDLCLLAIIHDIGAYKTDEIDRMIHFESIHVWQHAIYGHIFVNHIEALSHLSPLILFHHAGRDKLRYVDESYHELAQIFYIADRIDMLGLWQGKLDRNVFEGGFNRGKSVKFFEHLLDLFDATLFGEGQPDTSLLYRDISLLHKADEPEFPTCEEILGNSLFQEDAVTDYLNMLVHSIDFRSPQTVTHTVGVAAIAEALAEWFNLDARTKRQIRFGALIHDLGKQGIPPEILEADRRLEPHEFDVMRSHVMLSEQVLTNHVDPVIIRIAVRHHERIDGKGYHHKVPGAELTFPERLVAVADVLSALLGVRSYKDAFPKEKVLSIIGSMSDSGHLDPQVVGVASAEMDELIAIMQNVSERTRTIYEQVQDDYKRLLHRFDDKEEHDGTLVVEQKLNW